MQFETVCPNDHIIRFPLEMAGKKGQCPKCSATFEMPSLEDIRESLGDEMDEEMEAAFREAEKKQKELARQRLLKRQQLEAERARQKALEEAQKQEHKEGDSPVKAPPAASSGISVPPAAPPSVSSSSIPAPPPPFGVEEKAPENAADDGPLVQFLCPNGHELSASVEQVGKVGKCPECGAKFRVPEPDDESEEEENGPELELELDLFGNQNSPPPLPVGPAMSAPPLGMGFDVGDDKQVSIATPGVVAAPVGLSQIGKNPIVGLGDAPSQASGMATVFTKLWNDRAEGKTLYVHTSDSASFEIKSFEEGTGFPPFVGTFRAQMRGSDNEITLVLRWDSIIRISVE
ncbi:MAG: hypothetical protein Q4D38_07250 [Planctomycetia bacterium]|nr:hypothetical protein [Planctomycetia bacterium]